MVLFLEPLYPEIYVKRPEGNSEKNSVISIFYYWNSFSLVLAMHPLDNKLHDMISLVIMIDIISAPVILNLKGHTMEYIPEV